MACGQPRLARLSGDRSIANPATADQSGLFNISREKFAHFVHLDRFTDRLGGSWPIPVLVEIFPLTSYRLALRLHNEVPGIVVPDAFQEQLQDAGADAAALGFARARELIAGSRERAAGVCVIAPFRRPIRVLELLE